MIMTAAQRVLLIESVQRESTALDQSLATHGFDVAVERIDVDSVGVVQNLMRRIEDHEPEALVLHLRASETVERNLCRSIRSLYDGTILIVTSNLNEDDEVAALEIGVDDYVEICSDPRVLVARINARVKTVRSRLHRSDEVVVTVDSLRLDTIRRTVSVGDRDIALTTGEYELLRLLVTHPGTVLTREWMYEELQGIQYNGLDRSLDLRVSRLRKKLEADPREPRRIKSVRGVGYMLCREECSTPRSGP